MTDDNRSVVSSITTQDLQQPILVGYAFGPKKMSTMATVMAEASRATIVGVVTEEDDETDGCNEQQQYQHQQQQTVPTKHKKHALTTAALSRHSRHYDDVQQQQKSFTAGGSLNNIVRYFRSSCSSIASDDTFTTSCSTTIGGTTTRSHSSSSYHRVRVSFVPVNLNEPLEEQHGGRFDILLHKMTEDILCLSTAETNADSPLSQENNSTANDDPSALQQAMVRIHRLQEYQRLYPQCCVSDDPDHVKVVMSRSAISSKLETALVGVTSSSGWSVATPTFVNYDNCGGDATPTTHEHLKYPLIAKPLPAAGTKKSHCMGIVLNQKGLAHVNMNTPCLLQEYANHDGTLYKVYVLGDDIFVFQRPSLPNLPSNDELLNTLQHAYVEFDSQKPYPKLADFGLNDSDNVATNNNSSNNVLKSTFMTAPEVAPIVQALKRAFGLELFGFDILVSSVERKLLVVDVNYFPSFKEVSNFPALLAKFLVQRAVQTRKVTTASSTGAILTTTTADSMPRPTAVPASI